MKYILLSGKYSEGNYTIIDDEDFDKVSKYSWQIIKRPIRYRNKMYVRSTFWNSGNSKTVLLHRYLIQAPYGMQVDHINGNTLDNRKSNLRICTCKQNQMNQTIQNRNNYGYKGVRKIGNRWLARIGKEGKEIHIGSFYTKDQAASAYNKKAIELFGEFANLNKVEFVDDMSYKEDK